MTIESNTRGPGALVPLRDRRRADTRREIAEAALGLFEQQGYDNTTVEQIADSAGVSLRTFYRYCSSKDEVLTKGLISGPADLASAVREHDSLPLLEAVVVALISVSDSEAHRREIRLMSSTPALRAAWLAAGRETQEDLARVVLDRAPDESPLQARARAAAITGVLTMVIETWAHSDSTGMEQLARQALLVVAPS